MTKFNFTTGDQIAYSAKFLRSTGQFTGNGGARRGAFLAMDEGMPGYARVRWDHEAELLAANAVDPEWCDDVRQKGSLVFAGNIAKVGSARFALNDL